MGISDLIASFLQESLEEADGGVLEVQRNDLAQRFNCVPSQINYVMSTRFSPERGYIVESRRGGNGYIRITRVRVDRQTLLMQAVAEKEGVVCDDAALAENINDYFSTATPESYVEGYGENYVKTNVLQDMLMHQLVDNATVAAE